MQPPALRCWQLFAIIVGLFIFGPSVLESFNVLIVS